MGNVENRTHHSDLSPLGRETNRCRLDVNSLLRVHGKLIMKNVKGLSLPKEKHRESFLQVRTPLSVIGFIHLLYHINTRIDNPIFYVKNPNSIIYARTTSIHFFKLHTLCPTPLVATRLSALNVLILRQLHNLAHHSSPRGHAEQPPVVHTRHKTITFDRLPFPLSRLRWPTCSHGRARMQIAIAGHVSSS